MSVFSFIKIRKIYNFLSLKKNSTNYIFMKILAGFWAFLCLIIAFFGLDSIFTHEDITLEQTQFYEGFVSEINIGRGETKYTFEKDSINIYKTSSITNSNLYESEVEAFEAGQNYSVHYVDYDEEKDKVPYRKKIVTLSKNGQEILSLAEYNDSYRSNARWGGILGIIFSIFGLFFLLMIFYTERYIEWRRKKIFKKLEQLSNYEDGVIIIQDYEVKVQHELRIIPAKTGSYERMVIFIPVPNDISVEIQGKIISKFETKVIEGTRYVIHFYMISWGLTISKFEKWINKNVDELDNFIQKK